VSVENKMSEELLIETSVTNRTKIMFVSSKGDREGVITTNNKSCEDVRNKL